MLKFLTIWIPGLKASEWGTYFCLEKTDIILVSVHLIHNTCILKRESFSEAPVHMLLRLCLAFVSTASPRWISRNTSERGMGRLALLKWLWNYVVLNNIQKQKIPNNVERSHCCGRGALDIHKNTCFWRVSIYPQSTIVSTRRRESRHVLSASVILK